jgi:hypothetical protein
MARATSRKRKPKPQSDAVELKAKLKRIVEKKLDMLEREIDKAGTEPPAKPDPGRTAREVGSLLRAHERLESVVAKERAGRSAKAVKNAGTEGEDAEHWRSELAERIRKLRNRYPD